jgi:hypothetical protein
MMPVCESMEECNFAWARPSPPSCARSVGSPPPVVYFLEISSQNSTNGVKESGKVDVHLPFLELVHIVNTSVNELLNSE